MVIVATAVFERAIHNAYCADESNPLSPRLVVDAVTRDGDLDGPLLLSVPMFRLMLPDTAEEECLSRLRAAERIVFVDGVAHVMFPTWTVAET
jgi:hypothetical protein